MHTKLIVVAVFISLPSVVAGASPAVTVFGTECRAIDSKVTGFTCDLRPQGLAIHWVEKQSEMTAARRDRSIYERERIVLRYFDLGGRAFDVTASYWPKGAHRMCFAMKPRYQTYTCVDKQPSEH
jgi:hypothetical protein